MELFYILSAALLFRKVTGKFGADESTRRFSARLEVSKTPMVWSVALPDCIEERKTEEQLRANFEAVFDACASRLLQC